MVEPTRPAPSAEELEQLNDAFRRDPGRTFVPLGEALLALCRPRDAVDVGARGLKVAPQSLDGRIMVARAFAMLHQWKEAQAELLKVVKTDRNHGAGFRLLGEILMRRADYERALPVLQHAQNLNPADGSILALLKRARSGQPLDPPPPVPAPLEALPQGRGGGGYPGGMPHGGPRADSSSFPLDDLPTKVAGEIDTASGPTGVAGWGAGADPAIGRMPLEQREVRRPPLDGPVRHSDGRGLDRMEQRPVDLHAPPPSENVFAPLGVDPAMAQDPMRARMPLSAGQGAAGMANPAGVGGNTLPPGVRPRVMPVEKPRDAAQASLRQSAAVGEHYLNNLLMAGLLDVPRVRVPDASYDLAPGRRWGRSTVRMFIYLFVFLIMGTGGAGAWYWYAAQQRNEDVARHIKAASGLIEAGEYEGLTKADTEIRAALERDRDNPYAVSMMAEITSLELYLYGEINPGQVQNAIDLASQDIKKPGDNGYRELTLARAANTLATLPTLEEGADTRLRDARRGLKTWLDDHPDDGLARWLDGEAQWAAGDRKGALAAFEKAQGGGKGPVLATIALADMKLDDGKFEEAKDLYDKALKRAPKHPWAFLGRSLDRSERSAEIGEAVADLNVGVAQKRGPRVEAYKHLALATAYLGQEDYESFAKELDQATGVEEPRFLVRVGLLRAQQGNLAAAAKARQGIRWYADKPQPDPLLIALNAELLLGSGLASEAYAEVEKQDGLRAARLRGQSLFDLGKASEALRELNDALEIAPNDLDLEVWTEAARLVSQTGDERRKADDALDSLGRKAKSKAARVIHGVALAAIGKLQPARDKLELSLKDISDEYPNPLAYRAHVALAEIDAAEGKTDSAIDHAKKALELNQGYLPAHDLLGRLLIDSAPDQARPHLIAVVDAGVASVGAELAYARAVMPSDKPEDKKAASDALRRAKKKGATPDQLAAVIPTVDPALFQELGVTPPKTPPSSGGSHHHHHH